VRFSASKASALEHPLIFRASGTSREISIRSNSSLPVVKIRRHFLSFERSREELIQRWFSTSSNSKEVLDKLEQ